MVKEATVYYEKKISVPPFLTNFVVPALLQQTLSAKIRNLITTHSLLGLGATQMEADLFLALLQPFIGILINAFRRME